MNNSPAGMNNGENSYGQNGNNNPNGTYSGNYQQSEHTQNPGPLSTGMIQRIQGRLGQLGFYHGNVDGTWGPETQAAVRDFQQQRGLQTSGFLDYRTMADLGLFGQNQSQYGGNVGNQNTENMGQQGFNNNPPNSNSGTNQGYGNNTGMNQGNSSNPNSYNPRANQNQTGSNQGHSYNQSYNGSNNNLNPNNSSPNQASSMGNNGNGSNGSASTGSTGQ
jgi:peptidoglycan hydrolase-like protein with peptidoglycan-binding domain